VIKPELKPLQSATPGYARLTLKGWKGGKEEVLVSVMTNQGNVFLGSNGQWASTEMFLSLPVLDVEDEVPGVAVGPELVDLLLANRQAAYRLTVKDSASQDMGVLVMHDGLLSSQAGGDNPRPANTRVLPVTSVRPEPEPVSMPEPQPVAQESLPELETPEERIRPVASAKKIPLVPILAVVLLLAVLGGGSAWWFMRTPSQPTAPVPAAQPTQPVAASVDNNPCSETQMNQSNALDFVKDCARSSLNSTQILEVIEKAKAGKHCEIAQRLYAYKAQSGDTQIAMRYAQEYDPKTVSQNGCFSADPQTAIYWYESILSHDPQNSDAKARLDELKK